MNKTETWIIELEQWRHLNRQTTLIFNITSFCTYLWTRGESQVTFAPKVSYVTCPLSALDLTNHIADSFQANLKIHPMTGINYTNPLFSVNAVPDCDSSSPKPILSGSDPSPSRRVLFCRDQRLSRRIIGDHEQHNPRSSEFEPRWAIRGFL